MTNHPITPPLELIESWYETIPGSSKNWKQQAFTKAVQWGADQQLDQCVAWLDGYEHEGWAAEQMRTDCRPKQPTPKELALLELADVYGRDMIDDSSYDTIRVALEALPE
jgi:hypothetical protein